MSNGRGHTIADCPHRKRVGKYIDASTQNGNSNILVGYIVDCLPRFLDWHPSRLLMPSTRRIVLQPRPYRASASQCTGSLDDGGSLYALAPIAPLSRVPDNTNAALKRAISRSLGIQILKDLGEMRRPRFLTPTEGRLFRLPRPSELPHLRHL